jgi:hypothetical protein
MNTQTQMTRDGLKELRGLILSVITGDSRLLQVWDQQHMHPSWIQESVTRIVAKGYVTTIAEFRKRFSRWMQNPPKNFNLYQMRLLEHACGCPQYEFEVLPVYCALNPEPATMTPEEGGDANRKHSQAWSNWCRETERLLKTFGDDDMCNDFENKKTGRHITASPDGLTPLPEGGTRIFFASKTELLDEMKANAAKWWEFQWSVQRAADGRLVVDVLPPTFPTESAA